MDSNLMKVKHGNMAGTHWRLTILTFLTCPRHLKSVMTLPEEQMELRLLLLPLLLLRRWRRRRFAAAEEWSRLFAWV